MNQALPRVLGRRRRYGLASLLAVTAFAISTNALAIGAAEAFDSAQRSIAYAERSTGEIERAIANAKAEERTPEARIADGELLLRTKDYERAAILFNQVIEQHKAHPTAYPDALFLLGETYYASKQLMSARRVYREMADHIGEPRFAPYLGKGLARLVDVAVRLDDHATIDDVFAKMSQLPSSSIEGGLQYARGKGLYAKGDYLGAKTALEAVPMQSGYAHQAKYLLGVVALKQAGPAEEDETLAARQRRYSPAIEQFRLVTRLSPASAEQQHVVDLAFLAIGRLHGEAEQFAEAAEAYSSVDRGSPELSSMLYELAWVYLRMGDTDRAQRMLEILAVTDPESSYLADGSLLRADLMLRGGQFEKSLEMYETVRAQFDPMRDKVSTFLVTTSDPAVFYDRLVEEPADRGMERAVLPQLAITWAREAADGPFAFAVIDDAQQCRLLLRKTGELIDKAKAVLGAPNRVRAFPELRAGEEKALSLINTVSMARFMIAQGLDDIEDDASTELRAIQAERRRLQERLRAVPITDSDFAARDEQAQRQWNAVSQKLQQLTLQVDQLQAIVNGLRRTLREGGPAASAREEAESSLMASEQELEGYRAHMGELRKMIDAGRLQVGFGDQRFVEDAEVRAAFRGVLAEELRRAALGEAGRKAVAYAERARGLLAQADATEAKLQAMYDELETKARDRSRELHELVEVESANARLYAERLEALDSEARVVVGEVAMRNFGLVRDRLKEIVLRADVGITEQAWELREEQMGRLRNLQLERVRAEQRLEEELREVLDDAGEDETHHPGAKK